MLGCLPLAQPRSRITVLGRLSIDGASIAGLAALHGRRSELVFAYLAVEHQRTVSREELADALWPGMLPDSWAAALRGVVTDVRRFLDAAGLDSGEFLGSARGGYRLLLPDDMIVDVQEARDAVASARAQMDAGDPRAVA
jgi:DNA-binding SARP family transcriptional activator